jgi:hypothetical protein
MNAFHITGLSHAFWKAVPGVPVGAHARIEFGLRILDALCQLIADYRLGHATPPTNLTFVQTL